MMERSEMPADPIALFLEWFEEAKKSESLEPEAMALSTVSVQGQPNVRMVLMKAADVRGFVFFTNAESTKGRELKENARAALCFYWKSLRKQVRVRGIVEPVSATESDAYFASRPRGSQLSAWASQQSRPLKSRTELEEAVVAIEQRYADQEVPRPPHWFGFRIQPLEIEFMQTRPSRLHERLLFHRDDIDGPWGTTLLYP
jgi:pyridoxamine 5'-phosphate oxidase